MEKLANDAWHVINSREERGLKDTHSLVGLGNQERKKNENIIQNIYIPTQNLQEVGRKEGGLLIYFEMKKKKKKMEKTRTRRKRGAKKTNN